MTIQPGEFWVADIHSPMPLYQRSAPSLSFGSMALTLLPPR
jgi:hypothetical protein